MVLWVVITNRYYVSALNETQLGEQSLFQWITLFVFLILLQLLYIISLQNRALVFAEWGIIKWFAVTQFMFLGLSSSSRNSVW